MGRPSAKLNVGLARWRGRGEDERRKGDVLMKERRPKPALDGEQERKKEA